jgi:hypothetical protein
MRIGMTLWAIGRGRITLNEGGRFLTFFWCRRLRMVRIWWQPKFWGRSIPGKPNWFVERVWRY